MPTIIDSLLVSLGFKVEAEGLEGFAKTAEQVKHGAEVMFLAIEGVAAGIEHMVHSAVQRLGGIQAFSEQMGIGAREVDALGRVARENDSSLESMEGALRSMTMMAGQAAQGIGRGAMIFKRFGINVRDGNGHVKTTEQLLGDVADRLQKLPSLAQKQALGARLGFDPALIKLLSQGRDHFNELREAADKANPFREEDYEAGLATEKAFKKAGAAVELLKNRLAIGLLPTVNRLLARFTAWVKDSNNVAKIQRAIDLVVRAAEALWTQLDRIVIVLGVMKAHAYGTMFIAWGASIMKVVAGLKSGAAASALLASGFTAVKGVLTGGLLALFALAAEDLWTYYQGGTSVTGWMMDRFPAGVDVMAGALEVLGGAFLALTLGSGPVGLFAATIGAVIRAGFLIHDAWNPMMQWFGEKWDWLLDKVKAFLNFAAAPLAVAAKLMGVDLQFDRSGYQAKQAGAGKARGDMTEAEFNAANQGFNNRTNKGLGALDAQPNMLTWGADLGGTARIGNVNTNIGPTTINVNGAGDPKAVADRVERRQNLRAQRARQRTRDVQTGHR